ncbi:uncharacterized protein LOC123506517 [Portunus trituberculatus]|uniref:Uncharacterized protein n=1 Tax=Portunus trituberculatus TaxID=210409 RepID=A0A5B7D2N3_PORTR|nr:uncharacterized protein LOC123506517 [Portunus trituberculatus]MPC14756.1 hypothetical protein [Portunus trituberculatus]
MANTILRAMLAAAVIAWLGTDLAVGQVAEPDTSSPETSAWTPGRIAQVTLAVIESALLTFVLLFPAVMDPVVQFINDNIGSSGSRRRREVQSVVMDQAASLHSLLLDAIDQFEDMDYTLTSLKD